MWQSVFYVVLPRTGSDDPVGCGSARWSERVAGELIGSFYGTIECAVCLFEPGVPGMRDYVNGIVLIGIELIGDVDCNSRTGSPVSCVRTVGTGGMGCDTSESIGSVLRTDNSGVGIFELGGPDRKRCVSSVVSARTGSDVSIDDIVWGLETGDPVGCVSPGWTGGVECGDYGGLLPSTRPGPMSQSPNLVVRLDRMVRSTGSWSVGPVRTAILVA